MFDKVFRILFSLQLLLKKFLLIVHVTFGGMGTPSCPSPSPFYLRLGNALANTVHLLHECMQAWIYAHKFHMLMCIYTWAHIIFLNREISDLCLSKYNLIIGEDMAVTRVVRTAVQFFFVKQVIFSLSLKAEIKILPDKATAHFWSGTVNVEDIIFAVKIVLSGFINHLL